MNEFEEIKNLEKKYQKNCGKIVDIHRENVGLLEKTREKMVSLMNTRTIFGLEPREIEEFTNTICRNELQSTIVKRVVSAVRKVFFDDGDQKFRDLSFVGARFMMGAINLYYISIPRAVWFDFVFPSGEFLSLVVPMIYYNTEPYSISIPQNEEIFDFGFKVLSHVNEVLFKSPDVSEIRGFLEKNIRDGRLNVERVKSKDFVAYHNDDFGFCDMAVRKWPEYITEKIYESQK